jgi:hypothetical protein
MHAYVLINTFDGHFKITISLNMHTMNFDKLYKEPRPSGASGSVVGEALCYKLEGRGMESRWGGFFFQFT